MPLENIISKILTDADMKARSIKTKARDEASLLIKEAEENAQSASSEILKKTKQMIAVENRRLEVSQAIEYKKATLEKKQELVKEAFNKAKEELVNLDDDAYLSLMKAALVLSIDKGNETLSISKADKGRINDDFLKSLNSELKKSGKEGKLTLKVKEDLRRGDMIIETKDTILDIGLDAALKDLRDELTPEVARILFKDSRGK